MAREGAAWSEVMPATDVETRFLAGLEALNVEVLRHDVTVDPRPGDPFDLIHARNVLFHLPERDHVLDRLVSWLRPGGWLLVEDSFMMRDLVPWPVLARFYAALEALLAARVGSDYRWPLTLPGLLRARGLVRTGAAACIPEDGPAGAPEEQLAASPAAETRRLMFQQLRPAMLSAGLISEADAGAIEEALDDPTLVHFAGGIVSAWGRRPPD